MKRTGREKTNLEKIVIIKSTSPVKDFIIVWVNNDKKIKIIQVKDPIKFGFIINLIKNNINWTCS